MKRSIVNKAIKEATQCFHLAGWVLPPNPKWDVTDFGLGDFAQNGLVLVNLSEESEYCEKLMYAKKGQLTPAHCHGKKKEDIICRWGTLAIRVWNKRPDKVHPHQKFALKINGYWENVTSGEVISLAAGERVTLPPGIYHEFFPESEECIIGEVSTANDDLNDNFFVNPDVGRFSELVEDEAPIVQLVSD